MSKNGFSKYHAGIVVTYAVLIPVIFIFAPSVLRFDFPRDYLGIIIAAVACAIFAFFYFFGLWRAIFGIFYGVLFAFPEEIIFRGVIQTWLQNHIASTAIAILFSSLIFGIAHLPNGAKGFHPKLWNWKFSALAFLAGLPLGVIFAFTKSLFVPTLLHVFLVAAMKIQPRL